MGNEPTSGVRTGTPSPPELQRLLLVLTAATFLVFFQAFLVAPLIPELARIFDVSPRTMGFIEPAFLIPYGAMVLIWGPLSDRGDGDA